MTTTEQKRHGVKTPLPWMVKIFVAGVGKDLWNAIIEWWSVRVLSHKANSVQHECWFRATIILNHGEVFEQSGTTLLYYHWNIFAIVTSWWMNESYECWYLNRKDRGGLKHTFSHNQFMSSPFNLHHSIDSFIHPVLLAPEYFNGNIVSCAG